MNDKNHLNKKIEYVTCPNCQVIVRKSRLDKHRQQKCINRVIEIPKYPKIYLFSKINQKLYGAKICSRCNTTQTVVWRYLDSSIGAAYLCSTCKKDTYNLSFDKKDALDFAILGGGFETNRRKH